jgi:prepilin-type N-terminal cleavage/methylation domain-containing protein
MVVHMNKFISIDNGFTLVEILMTIIILGVVILIVTSMIIQSFSIVDDSSQRITQNRLVEIMLEDISKYFRSATDFTVVSSNVYEFEAYSPYNGNENTYRISYNDTDSELTFEENNNVLREVTGISFFDMSSGATSNSYIYQISVKYIDENGIQNEKQINLYARNLASSED